MQEGMNQQEIVVVQGQPVYEQQYQNNYQNQYQQYPQQQQVPQQQQPYPPSQQVVLIESPMPANGCRMPVQIICPYCMKSGFTVCEYRPGGKTWMCCIIWFICFCPAACLPFCMDDCKDCYSICPSCLKIVGIAQ